ncbi:hypothetical protein ACHAWF_003631 [Thalassiosira exigua]
MACSKDVKFMTNGRRFVVSIFILLVGYSSMNWDRSFLMSTSRPDVDADFGHNATLSESPGGSIRDDIFSNTMNATAHLKSDATKPSAAAAMQQLPSDATNSTSVPSNQIALPLPNASAPPISFSGCCGIGHRLARNIPTMVYAISHSRPLHANWKDDVEWSVLFNDTEQIKEGPPAKEHYANGFPLNWTSSPIAWHEKVDPQGDKYTAYHYYEESIRTAFEMPLAQSIVKSLSDNLSSLVLSFLQPMRQQYAKSDLHLCVHVREGNNETGDWERKKWRHIELLPTLNATLGSMKRFATKKSAQRVSVFVASDNKRSRTWFEENSPEGWHIVKPARELPRPEQGVWFGELVSPTNTILSKDELNEAMAEAVAEVFALGECHALFIPNSSSFSVVGIMLARLRRKSVFFLWFKGSQDYIKYPQ